MGWELLEGCADAVLVLDPSLRVIHANQAAASWWGDVRAGASARALFGAARTEVERLVDQAGAGEARGRIEALIGDAFRIVDLVARPIAGADWVMVTARDLTKEIAEERALRRQRDRLLDLFSALDQGFALNEVVRDPSGMPVDYCLSEFNPAFLAQTGLPASCLGKTVREVLGTEVTAEWIATMCRVATEQLPIVLERSSDTMGRTFEVHAFPVGGDRFGTLVRDVTERRRAEEGQRQAQRLESLGLLAGGIAHDFNNVFTAVLGNLDLARLEVGEDAELSRRLRMMESGLLRAQALVRQVQAYAGRAHSAPRPLDVSTLIRAIADLLRVSVPRTVALDLDLSSRPPEVEADEAQLQQLVVNLITNAAEALGDVPGTVTLRTGCVSIGVGDEDVLAQGLSPGPHLLLDVSDNGPGMDERTRKRMFEPFYSTKGVGRGLGLSAVGGIVRAHNGAIRVRTAPGEGTTLQVFLPARSNSVSPAPRDDAAETLGGGRALVVDDDPLVRSTATAMMEALGFDTCSATDGEEAVARVRSDPTGFRVVLLDLMMPGRGGAWALDSIRTLNPDLPVLLCSGYQDGTALAGVSLDEVPFLPKPFQIGALRSALQRIVR